MVSFCKTNGDLLHTVGELNIKSLHVGLNKNKTKIKVAIKSNS